MFGKFKNKLKGIFGSKEEEKTQIQENEELENLEDEMLEDVSAEEKKAIKEHTKLSDEEVEENLEILEKQVEVEEKLEEENFEEETKLEEKKNKDKFEKIDEKISEFEENTKEVENIDVPKEEKQDEIIEESLDVNETEDVEEIIEETKTEEKKSKKSGGIFGKIFSGITNKKLSEEDFDKVWEELEIFLLEINIAYEIVSKIEEKLRETIIGENFDRFSLAKSVKSVLIEEVSIVLKNREEDLISEIKKQRKENPNEPVKIMILGVNGTGKTTTIAKICKLFEKNNLSLVVAAGDTFRAAAVEQLEEHSIKAGFKLIKHVGGSDPAAVGYDAINHAKAKNLDIVIIDTAGRMPNNKNLMQELEKIKRVCNTNYNIFIGDSVSGNDLLEQIELFDKIVPINGFVLTKTDTDERPGSIVTAAYSIEKPIYFLGIGQTYDDLVIFDSKEVAEKLFDF